MFVVVVVVGPEKDMGPEARAVLCPSCTCARAREREHIRPCASAAPPPSPLPTSVARGRKGGRATRARRFGPRGIARFRPSTCSPPSTTAAPLSPRACDSYLMGPAPTPHLLVGRWPPQRDKTPLGRSPRRH